MSNIVIQIKKNNVKYNGKTKTFTVSGKEIKFGTQYMILNEETEKYIVVNLKESTGSEWDPNTIWIYKTSDDKFTLNVLNDDVTEQHKQNYLRAKLQH